MACDRWRELARDPKSHIEAVRAYRKLYKNADLVEAARRVTAYYDKFTKSLPKR